MLISELISVLTRLRDTHGDIQVGFEDGEFRTFDAIRSVRFMTQRTSGPWHDDKDLGEKFIGIGWGE